MSKCYYCDKEAKYKSTVVYWDDDVEDFEHEEVDVCEEHKLKDQLEELESKTKMDELTIIIHNEIYRINLNFANFINVYKQEDKFVMRIVYENWIVKVYYDINLNPIEVKEVYINEHD